MTTIEQARPTESPMADASSAPLQNPVRRGPILLAIHGLESSPAAIATAHLVATRLFLGVEVISVTPAEPVYPPPLDILNESGGTSRRIEDRHKEEVQVAIQQALSLATDWPITVGHGQAAHEVARTAHTLDATMVIVNSTPTGGILRTMAGSFAAEVARRAPCPVFAATDSPTAMPRRIIAAVDFSPASIRAVQAALLVADANATMTLVHVPLPVRLGEARVNHSGAPIGGDVAILFARLEAELRRYAPGSVTMQHTVADGRPTAAILDRARSQGADLVVAGTRGPNRLERFFVGSTAVGLLHHAPCAVLIAPTPPPAERLRLELGMADAFLSDDPKEWADILNTVAVRNRGRFVTLEVSGVLTAHADHFILRDLAYDPVDRCIEIRVSDTADGRCGITRTVGHPGSIIVNRAPDGRERALEVVQDRGHTQVLFLDDVTN